MGFGDVVKNIVVWSDGGLKTKENLYYFHLLSKTRKVQILVNFFAPYHGHSECDGHFGAVKTELKSSALNGPVTSKEQILEAFKRVQGKSKIHSKVQLITVPKNEINLQPLKNQIQKFLEWEFFPDGRCRSRELTRSDGPWTEHQFVLSQK